MSRAGTKRPSAEQQRAVLRGLTQQVAAELVGKSPAYLRDQSHSIQRNDDGTYSGEAIVRWAVSKCPPAELTDAELEPVLQIIEGIPAPYDEYGTTFKVLDEVRQRYGNAGMAAVGLLLYENLKACHEAGPDPAPEEPSREEIEAAFIDEARRKADEHFAYSQKAYAFHTGRSVTECATCKRWRLGRTWNNGPLPTGHAIAMVRTECPNCIRQVREGRRG